MRLVALFVVFVALAERTCSSKILIEINRPNGFAKLGEAVKKILTTCYADKDDTVILLGNFPGNFIESLSSHRSSSLVLRDPARRAKDNIDYSQRANQNTVRKVPIIVMIVSSLKEYVNLFNTLLHSKYCNHAGSVLILGWSPEKRYRGCGDRYFISNILFQANMNGMLNVKFMCLGHPKGPMLIGSNIFTNEAPKPWRLIKTVKTLSGPYFSVFMRFVYGGHADVCENLDYDKTRDLGGWTIKVLEFTTQNMMGLTKPQEGLVHGWRVTLDRKKKLTFFENFLTYANATSSVVEVPIYGSDSFKYRDGFTLRGAMLRGQNPGRGFYPRPCSYPHSTERTYLITQFRGNKSQLRKIIDIIDDYSWYGVLIVYAITLVFLKYFLYQSLLVAILNLCRLTCNCGIEALPPNVAARIYLACLLAFVVTIQGIFAGNLAALLTQDIPLRQVDSIQDLADLNYSVYVDPAHEIIFHDPVFKNRVILFGHNEVCWQNSVNESQSSCVSWGVEGLDYALEHNLYVSTGSVSVEYVCSPIPRHWSLEVKFNDFLGIVIAGGIMTDLDGIVLEKRLHEVESEEVPVEPRIMTLDDLGFGFVILGIGLAFASIVFIFESIIYRFHRPVTRTRAIVL